MFSWLTFWTYFTLFSTASIVDFEQVNVDWELSGIKVRVFFWKNIDKNDKNYYYFWKSNIPVINLIVDSRNMIKDSNNMSLQKIRKNGESRFHQIPTIS